MDPEGVLLVLSGLLGRGGPMKHGAQQVNIYSGVCGSIQVPPPEWVRFTLSFEMLGIMCSPLVEDIQSLTEPGPEIFIHMLNERVPPAHCF